ncbi:MAG: type II toxin-antitoxin system RelE/ParE family toxin [Planctomycetia bacterium]|nr:type II toxin-antitoxin system RelE/ParE family toxin [Planctomycetia bacterium]
MARVIWSLRAIEQLETLVEYVASYSPLEPRRFAQKIFDRTDQLGDPVRHASCRAIA